MGAIINFQHKTWHVAVPTCFVHGQTSMQCRLQTGEWAAQRATDRPGLSLPQGKQRSAAAVEVSTKLYADHITIQPAL
jgi:hypothetical protein